MLDNDLKTQLAAYLEKVVQPIELVAALDDSEAARELDALLQDIAALSASITLRRDDAAAVRRPSFAIARTGSDVAVPAVEVRFAAVPMGHEFTSLVLALLQVGGHPPKVSAAIADQIRALPGEYHFETFM